MEEYTLKLEDHLTGCETDIGKLILRIGDISKTISQGFASRQSSSDTKNVDGEQQMALD